MDPTIPAAAELKAAPPAAPTPATPAAARACPNCGAVASMRARYCTGCGQRQDRNLLTVRVLLDELLEEVLSLDGRLPRSLAALLVRPGHLTREYSAGRIARYVRPFRLYLASSVIFFLALSFSLRFGDQIEIGVAPVGGGASATDSVQVGAAAESGGVAIAADQLESATIDEQVRSALADARSSDEFSGVPSSVRLFVDSFVQTVAGNPTATISRLTERLLRDAPKAVFILLPVFALYLKGLYIRRRRLYVEHLVFVLHTHAFAFLLATILVLLPKSSLTDLLWFVFPIYLLLALRRVYGQSFLKTSFKFFVFGWMYLISVAITLLATVIVAAITLRIYG